MPEVRRRHPGRRHRPLRRRGRHRASAAVLQTPRRILLRLQQHEEVLLEGGRVLKRDLQPKVSRLEGSGKRRQVGEVKSLV